MVVWVIIRFSLVCLLSLVQVSFLSFKLALDRMENFKNPRSGPPGPPQEEDRWRNGPLYATRNEDIEQTISIAFRWSSLRATS